MDKIKGNPEPAPLDDTQQAADVNTEQAGPKKRGRGRPRKTTAPETQTVPDRVSMHPDLVTALAAPAPAPEDSTGEQDSPKKPKRTQKKTALAEASAETTVAGLDVLRDAISAGTVEDHPHLRPSVVAAWREYYIESGGSIPPWALVVVMSTAYVTPALKTAPARGLLMKIKDKIGGLVVRVAGWRR